MNERTREEIVIGTRGSALARWQAELVASALRRLHDGLRVHLEVILAPADAAPDVPIAEIGTKGLFTRTIEDALLDGRVDVAVHSLKDLASVMAPGLELAAIPPREDPRDALVSVAGDSLDALPAGARLGTSAPRRRAQLRRLRPDLELLDVRGNVDTRLRKLREGRYDALVLAAAGLHRLGRADAITSYIPPALVLPAGGQGALGIQVRAGDERMRRLVAPLSDRPTMRCCLAERRLQEVLEGGCRVPIGALARLDEDTLTLNGVVASDDGALLIRDTLSGPAADPAGLGERLAQQLLERGADEVLQAIRARQPGV